MSADDVVEQRDVDAAWHSEVGARLDGVLNGHIEMGISERAYAQFAAEYRATSE